MKKISQSVYSFSYSFALQEQIQSIKAKLTVFRQDNNWVDEHAWQDIATSMQRLYDYAFRYKQMQSLLADITDNISDWVFQSVGMGGAKTFLPPGLSECACVRSGNFNRLKNDRRARIETAIVKSIDEKFANTKDIAIDYLSFGAGNLLQDYILVAKLLLRGYKNLRIHLISSSSIWDGDNLEHALRQFNTLKFLADELGVSFTFHHYDETAEFIKTNLKPDIIVAIDIDEFHRQTSTFSDFMELHGMLKEDGRFFVSVAHRDFIFSKTQCLSYVQLDDLSLELADLASNKSSLRIINLSPNNHFQMLYDIIIPYIRGYSNLASISITFTHDLSSMEKVDFFDENFFSYIQLFLPGAYDFELKRILYSDTTQDLVERINAKDNVNFVIYQRSDLQGTKQALAEVDTVHDAFPNSDIYFGIRASSKKQAVHKPTISFFGSWLWDNTKQTYVNLIEEDEKNLPHIVKAKNYYRQKSSSVSSLCNNDYSDSVIELLNK